MNSKITEQHRSRPAYIYVRQSTNAQVLHHQESTERQYALRTMALELGWSESAIRTLDRDLGLKGTMAQAELHFLHARLQGGKLNKAKKGELRFPLPVGYCYDEQGRIVPDADAEVRGAVETVFRLFRETGSAYAVVHRFTEKG